MVWIESAGDGDSLHRAFANSKASAASDNRSKRFRRDETVKLESQPELELTDQLVTQR